MLKLERLLDNRIYKLYRWILSIGYIQLIPGGILIKHIETSRSSISFSFKGKSIVCIIRNAGLWGIMQSRLWGWLAAGLCIKNCWVLKIKSHFTLYTDYIFIFSHLNSRNFIIWLFFCCVFNIEAYYIYKNGQNMIPKLRYNTSITFLTLQGNQSFDYCSSV